MSRRPSSRPATASARMGGYVGASQTENVDDQPYATITYRIPADRWEDALDLLRGLNGLTSKVVSEQTQAVEVTGQVIDLEARIRNLRASETALQEIATQRDPDHRRARGPEPADQRPRPDRTAERRARGPRGPRRLRDADRDLQRAGRGGRGSPPKGWEPAEVVDEATASLVNILQALTTAGIWFAIVWLPLLLVLGAIVALGVWVGRRLGPDRAPPRRGDAPLG